MINELLRIDNGIKTVEGYDILAGVWIQIRQHQICGIISDELRSIELLFGILTGRERLDFGTISYKENRLEDRDVVRFLQRSVHIIGGAPRMIRQLSLAENMFLVSSSKHELLFDRHAMETRLRLLLEQYNLNLNIHMRVQAMTALQQYQFELVKSCMMEYQLILVDLHDSNLSPEEMNTLFTLIRQLRNDGYSFLVWNPSLQQLTEDSDYVIVLKNGKTARILESADMNERILSRILLGNTDRIGSDVLFRAGQLVFEFNGISDHVFHNLELSVRAGEILPLRFESMNALSDFCNLLTGDSVPFRGNMLLNGNPYQPASIDEAIRCGVSFIRDPSYSRNLFYQMSVFDNICLTRGNTMHKIWRNRRYRKSLRQTINAWFGRDICDERLDSLSENELQKVLFSRWRLNRNSLLVLANPFIGGCISMNESCMQSIHDLARQGTSILILSVNPFPYPSLNRSVRFVNSRGILADGRKTYEQ